MEVLATRYSGMGGDWGEGGTRVGPAEPTF